MEEIKDIGQNPIENQTPPPVELNENTGKPKKNIFLKVLVFLLLFLLIALVLYYLVFKINIIEKLTGQNLDNNGTTQVEDIQQEDEEILTVFEGEYIETQTPEGWSIQEFFNGEGTEMLTEGTTYTGLTGLKIFKEDTELFYMQAVSGIGFAGCPRYAKFTDENPDYYAQILEDNQVSGTEVAITDYTDSEYTEFTWFDTPFRRVGMAYIYDVEPGNEYFESPCVPTLVNFQDINLYNMGEGMDSSTFDYGAKESATEEDLLIIDQILGSMELQTTE